MQVESGATHSFILREENGVKTTELCASLCRETVEKLGFVLWDVEFQKEYGDWVLTFYIDKEGGVTIEDCEAVSRALEPVLDENDPHRAGLHPVRQQPGARQAPQAAPGL